MDTKIIKDTFKKYLKETKIYDGQTNIYFDEVEMEFFNKELFNETKRKLYSKEIYKNMNFDSRDHFARFLKKVKPCIFNGKLKEKFMEFSLIIDHDENATHPETSVLLQKREWIDVLRLGRF